MSYTVIPTKNEGNVGGRGYKSIYYDRKGLPILYTNDQSQEVFHLEKLWLLRTNGI